MTWYVKKKARDGRVASILSDDFAHARARCKEFRDEGNEAWIEDVGGRKVDESAPAQTRLSKG